jgi:hypothetical protein
MEDIVVLREQLRLLQELQATVRQVKDDPLLSGRTSTEPSRDPVTVVKALCGIIGLAAQRSTAAECCEIISLVRDLEKSLVGGFMFGDPANDFTPKPDEASH